MSDSRFDSSRFSLRVGLPACNGGVLLREAQQLGAATLISTGSLYRQNGGKNRKGFQFLGEAAWSCTRGSALDSAGFTAMIQGGYRWTVDQYVEFIVHSAAAGAAGSVMPFPWEWWSAMDYCCEPEIAANRGEVERRIDLTVESYGDTLDALEYWRGEGFTNTPDPLPILQGRTPADYVRCAGELAAAIDARHVCQCPAGELGGNCDATYHRNAAGLPELVGLGSVCRRELNGPEGLIAVLDALHAALPSHVRLHLFGVKGELLALLHRWGGRVASVDSMAWDDAARRDLQAQRRALVAETGITMKAANAAIPSSQEHRAQHLRAWYARQVERIAEADAAAQLPTEPTPPAAPAVQRAASPLILVSASLEPSRTVQRRQARSQRWRDRREVWRPAGEDTFNPSIHGVELLDYKPARAFVERHHYSGKWCADRIRIGLYRLAGWGRPELVGAAVFSQPMNQRTIPRWAGWGPETGIELGRFVLLDQVEGNGETWFLTRALNLIHQVQPQIRSVISYSDPVPRHLVGGRVVTPGHKGDIYQCKAARYVGRSKARTLVVGRGWEVVNDRALAKLRKRDKGWESTYRQLLRLGAPEREAGEEWSVYTPRAMNSPAFRRVRHHGNHAYLFAVGGPNRRRATRKLWAEPLPFPATLDPVATLPAATATA